jgi:putative oxidoreductase
MEFFKDLFLLLGRVLISGVFLLNAYEKIRNWNATAAYMKSKHVPQVSIVLPVFLVLKVVGGLLVFFGWHAHVGALFLLIVTVPAIWWMHKFWKLQGNERMIERSFFMKELAIVGGLLLILALGGGHWGVGHGG